MFCPKFSWGTINSVTVFDISGDENNRNLLSCVSINLKALKIKEGVRLFDVFVKCPERKSGSIFSYGGGNLLDLLDHGAVR